MGSTLFDMKSFVLTDFKGRSKISSDRYRIKYDVNLYPLSFFTNTPFKEINMVAFNRLNKRYSLKFIIYLLNRKTKLKSIIQFDIVFVLCTVYNELCTVYYTL